MSDDRPRADPEPDGTVVPPDAMAGGVGEPVVTDSPSSHQPRAVPPAGSEPQGRTTTIAAIVAIVVIAVIIAAVFLT